MDCRTYQILVQNLTSSTFGTLDIYMFMLPENCTHGKFHQRKIPPKENSTHEKFNPRKLFWVEISLT